MASAALGARPLVAAVVCQALVSGAIASVFIANQLISTFKTLETRKCLPGDFNASTGPPVCLNIVQGQLPAECEGQPILANFFNCHAASLGLLNANASAFDLQGLITRTAGRSGQHKWQASVHNIFARCLANVESGMSPRRQALYSFLCLKWSLFAACDRTQEAERRLDGDGARRGADFLSGDCPLSPATIKDIWEYVGHREFEECNRNVTSLSDADAHKRYDAGLDSLMCLLREFITVVRIDVPRLSQALFAFMRAQALLSPPLAAHRLMLDAIIPCSEEAGENFPLAEEFIKCYVRRSVFGCVYQQANQIASVYPNECDIPSA